jgi:hypothetical protein
VIIVPQQEISYRIIKRGHPQWRASFVQLNHGSGDLIFRSQCPIGVWIEALNPFVNELQAFIVDDLRTKMRHAARAEFGHAVVECGPFWLARCDHLGIANAKGAALRGDSQGGDPIIWQFMLEIHGN